MSAFQRAGWRLLVGYLLITLVFLIAVSALWLRYGSQGFLLIQGPADVTSVPMKFTVFCIAWGLLGLLLCVSQWPELAQKNALFLVAFLLIAFSYLNLLREPHKVDVGDFRAYYLAAIDIRQGQPISQEPGRLYLYPPLLATLLSPLVSLGLGRAAQVFHLANYFAILLLFCLLYRALQHYRFSKELAVVLTFLFLLVNVPVVNTLVYHQVNLHVVNLILLSLLLYPKYAGWSALALGLAVHLKVYPLLLAAPFVYKKQWRWCGWFVASLGAVILSTSLLNSPRYYAEFFKEAMALRETGLRNVSIDSFVFNTFRLLHVSLPGWEKFFANAFRIFLGGALLRVSYVLARRDAFRIGANAHGVVLSSYVLLPVLMLAVSPSVWPHHFVFLSLTVLVLLSRLREASEGWIYLLSYIFLFLMPINEIYPMSYLGLLAILLLLALFHRLTKHAPDAPDPEWFVRLGGALR